MFASMLLCSAPFVASLTSCSKRSVHECAEYNKATDFCRLYTLAGKFRKQLQSCMTSVEEEIEAPKFTENHPFEDARLFFQGLASLAMLRTLALLCPTLCWAIREAHALNRRVCASPPLHTASPLHHQAVQVENLDHGWRFKRQEQGLQHCDNTTYPDPLPGQTEKDKLTFGAYCGHTCQICRQDNSCEITSDSPKSQL